LLLLELNYFAQFFWIWAPGILTGGIRRKNGRLGGICPECHFFIRVPPLNSFKFPFSKGGTLMKNEKIVF
jgi:hypothetical protein